MDSHERNQIRISIHALLAESDIGIMLIEPDRQSISIHALLAESDKARACLGAATLPFLSTLSLRRATLYDFTRNGQHKDFYPRSPCGERPPRFDTFWSAYPKFLSTLSLRRATACCSLFTSTLINFYPRSPCGERPVAHL